MGLDFPGPNADGDAPGSVRDALGKLRREIARALRAFGRMAMRPKDVSFQHVIYPSLERIAFAAIDVGSAVAERLRRPWRRDPG